MYSQIYCYKVTQSASAVPWNKAEIIRTALVLHNILVQQENQLFMAHDRVALGRHRGEANVSKKKTDIYRKKLMSEFINFGLKEDC